MVDWQPNHMLCQFSTKQLTLHPDANILFAGREYFEAQNRKKLFSRIEDNTLTLEL